MLSLLVLLAALKFKFFRNETTIQYLRRKYDAASVTTYKNLESTARKLQKADLDLKFLYTCRLNCLVPNFVKFKLYRRSLYQSEFYYNATRDLLNLEINNKEKTLKKLKDKISQLDCSLKSSLSFLDIIYISTRLAKYIKTYTDRVVTIHNKKLSSFGISQPNFKFVDRAISNFSSYELSKKEKFLLTLGLDYCLLCLKPSYFRFFSAFEKLAHSISNFSSCDSFTSFRREVSHLAHKTFTSHWGKNWLPFINKDDLDLLKKLGSNKNIIITRPDKGNGVVLLDRFDYVNKMLNVLSDHTKFEKVDCPNRYKLIYKIEDRINRFLSKLKNSKVLSQEHYSELYVSGSSFGILYGSPKVHKGRSLSLRPILAAYNLPNYRLAKHLVPLLSHLTTNSHSIKNSYDFTNFITKQSSNQFLVSYDVESLFTNVPTHETINIILEKLFPSSDVLYCGFNKTDFGTLLQLAVSDNHFIFDDQIYKQTDGMAMGSPLGPTFANIFMNSLESQFLDTCSRDYKPSFYKRYVDDIIAGFPSKSLAQQFLQYINQAHPNIKFSMETETNNRLNFLDVTISKSPSHFSTNVFRKDTYTGLGLNFYNFCPDIYKFNSFKTLINRAYKICSDWFSFSQELQTLEKYFQQNNYPSHIFHKFVKAFLDSIYHPKLPVATVPKLVIYSPFPFLGSKTKQLQKEMTHILHKYYPFLNVKFAFSNNFRTKNFFKFKDSLVPLMRHNVVYLYTCPKCDLGRYIGCTTRLLRTRICGHMGVSHRTLDSGATKEKSAIRQHSIHCKTNVNFNDFKVLFSVSSKQSLLIAEFFFYQAVGS